MNLWSFVRWNNISIHSIALFYSDWLYCHLVRPVLPITVSLTLTPSSSDMGSLTIVRKILYDLFLPITIRPPNITSHGGAWLVCCNNRCRIMACADWDTYFTQKIDFNIYLLLRDLLSLIHLMSNACSMFLDFFNGFSNWPIHRLAFVWI